MAKRIAVLVRGRTAEALRMSLGLTLLDETVDVYVLGSRLEPGECDLHLETIREMEMKVYTDREENDGFELVSPAEAARLLLEYDHVLPY